MEKLKSRLSTFVQEHLRTMNEHVVKGFELAHKDIFTLQNEMSSRIPGHMVQEGFAILRKEISEIRDKLLISSFSHKGEVSPEGIKAIDEIYERLDSRITKFSRKCLETEEKCEKWVLTCPLK